MLHWRVNFVLRNMSIETRERAFFFFRVYREKGSDRFKILLCELLESEVVGQSVLTPIKPILHICYVTDISCNSIFKLWSRLKYEKI